MSDRPCTPCDAFSGVHKLVGTLPEGQVSRFIVEPFDQSVNEEANFAKTQKSRAAARCPGREIQEPECGPLHQ